MHGLVINSKRCKTIQNLIDNIHEQKTWSLLIDSYARKFGRMKLYNIFRF